MRLEKARVTYFWRQIPNTIYTIAAVVEGTPVPQTRLVLIPQLKAPSACPDDVLYPYAEPLPGASLLSYGCWRGTYSPAYPTVYHRLDILRQNADFPARFSAPWGGLDACREALCTYDTSAWVATQEAFVDWDAATAYDETGRVAYDMSVAATRGMQDVPAGGLRNASLIDLQVCSFFLFAFVFEFFVCVW